MNNTARLRLALAIVCLVGLWLAPLFVPGILNPYTPSAWFILYAQNLVGYSLIFLAPIGAVLIVLWDAYRSMQEEQFGLWAGLVLATGAVAIIVHVILCIVSTPLAFFPGINEFFFIQTGGGDVAGLRPLGELLAWPFLAMIIAIPVTAIIIFIAAVPLLSKRAHQAGAEAHEIVSCALLLLTLAGALAYGPTRVNSDRGVITALGAAARSGHVVAVRGLLQAGADPDRAGPYMGTPLQLAVFDNNNEVVKALLGAGARDTDGLGLIVASSHANPTMVGDLLAAKSPVNARARNDQETPLIAAAGAAPPYAPTYKSGTSVDQVVSLLVKAGADVNARDLSGRTALDGARRMGRESVVKMLIAAGAKP